MRWISRSRRADHAGDRQVGLHRRRQRRLGHAGQPRVLGLRGCVVGTRPLRIVDEFRGDLDQDDVAARKVEGGRLRVHKAVAIRAKRTWPNLYVRTLAVAADRQ